LHPRPIPALLLGQWYSIDMNDRMGGGGHIANIAYNLVVPARDYVLVVEYIVSASQYS